MAVKRRRRKPRGPGLVATLRDPDKIRVAYLIAGLALVFGGSLGFGATRCDTGPGSSPTQAVRGSDVLASIDDREIAYAEFWNEYNGMRRRTEASSDAILRPPEFEADLRYRTLRQMLDMEYFDIRATQAGIEVTNEQVEERIDQYRERLMPAQLVEEDRSLLQRFMDAMGAAKEEKAFERQLQSLDPTLTVDRLRSIVRQELMAGEYVSQITSDKDREIMNELAEEANGIRDEIIGGTEFAAAAMDYSEHQDSRAAGGLVPMVKHHGDNLPQSVIDSSFSLPVGEISLPIPSGEENFRGVWLLNVVSRVDASGEEWENAREYLRQQLLEDKRAQVESGELELGPDEDLTVTEEEIIAAYEEATVRVIYLRAEDPMGRVTEAVREDQASMRIVINNPELRAMHHLVNEQWELAAADYFDALQRARELAAEAAGDEEGITDYAVDMAEAGLRYLIANLWGTRAFRVEAEWLQPIFQQFQQNPEAFSGEFPEIPIELREEQQGYFVLAQKNLDRAIELEDMDPWYRWQRAGIYLGREQISPTLLEDLRVAHEYSSSDYELESRILNSLNQTIGLDDRALEEAGGVRPETWTDPVFPEDEMGLTLAVLDAPFLELIEVAREGSMPDTGTEETETVPDGESTTDLSIAEIEPELPEEPADEASDTVQPASQVPVTVGESRPTYVPSVPMAEPNGPFTQELKDELDELIQVVQAVVDVLNAQREAVEAERRALMEQQAAQLPPSTPVEVESPSEDSENLLTGEDEPSGE